MPRDRKTHIAQAAHNEALDQFLDGTPYTDWIATVTFYAALHYFQAYFLSKNPPQYPQRHKERDIAIDNDKFLYQIRNHYRDLQDVSEAARYYGTKPTASDLKAGAASHLAAIKKHLKQYIS